KTSNARKLARSGGESRQPSACPAAAKSACTSQNTKPPSACACAEPWKTKPACLVCDGVAVTLRDQPHRNQAGLQAILRGSSRPPIFVPCLKGLSAGSPNCAAGRYPLPSDRQCPCDSTCWVLGHS